MQTVVEKNVLRPESYVVEIDGKISSAYGIFVEALKAGMELKQKFKTGIVPNRTIQKLFLAQDGPYWPIQKTKFDCAFRAFLAACTDGVFMARITSTLSSTR